MYIGVDEVLDHPFVFGNIFWEGAIYLNSGINRTPSCKSGAGCAGVAVVGSGNQAALVWTAFHIRYMHFTAAHRKSFGKIKVAVV